MKLGHDSKGFRSRWQKKRGMHKIFYRTSICDSAPFFLALAFLLALPGRLCLVLPSSLVATGGGCVLSRWCWSAAMGSIWNAGFSNTAFSCALSLGLMNMQQWISYRKMHTENERALQVVQSLIVLYTSFCRDLQFSFNLVTSEGCWKTSKSGRNSESADRSYALNFLCLLLFFWVKETPLLAIIISWKTKISNNITGVHKEDI